MTIAVGANSYIAFGSESTYGVVPGSPTYYKLSQTLYGFELGDNFEELVSEAINSQIDFENIILGNEDIIATVPFELSIFGLPKFLRYFLEGSTTGAGPFTHTLKRGALPTGMFMEINYGGVLYVLLAGGKGQSLSLNIANSGLVKGQATILFAKVVSLQSTPISGGTLQSLNHVPIHHSKLTVTNEGGAPAVFQAFNITELSNNVTGLRKLGSATLDDTARGRGNVLGNVIFRLSDGTLLNKLRNQTQTSFQLTFTSGAHSLSILVNKAFYRGNALPGIPESGPIFHTMEFRGLHDTTETAFKMTIVNDESSLN
jgi:hypothetical protein